MATEKLLNTRIRLKYDSCSNWISMNPALLAGEIAIAYLSSTNAVKPGESDTQHPVLFKVGPGAFNDLPWASALAADVYEWAKKDGVKVEGNGNAFTSVGIGVDGYLTFEKGATFALAAEVDTIRSQLPTLDTNTTYTFEIPTEGEDAGKLIITTWEKGAENASKIEKFDIVTSEELPEVLKNYYTKDEVDQLLEALRDALDAIVIPDITVSKGTVDPEDGIISVVTDITPNEHHLTLSMANVPTKEYVDSKVAGAVEYLGTISSADELTTDAGKGDFYRALVEFILNDEIVHVGDLVIATTDNPTVADWDVAHTEMDVDTWQDNTVDTAGIVRPGNEGVNSVWATDGEGNPGWNKVQTSHIADNAVGAAQLKSVQGYAGEDAEVWVFYCGNADTLVD